MIKTNFTASVRGFLRKGYPIRVRPFLYEELIFLNNCLFFKKRPDEFIYSKRRVKSMYDINIIEAIDKYNYHLVINFFKINLKKKINFLKNNIKKLFCIYKIYFLILKNKIKKLNKIFIFFLNFLRKYFKYSKIFFKRIDHKSILAEIRKIKSASFTLKRFFKIRDFELRKYFYFFFNDIADYIYHLEQLRKEYDNKKISLSLLILQYHIGYQFIFRNLKQLFFDFNLFIKVIFRDFFIILLLLSQYKLYLIFLIKFIKKFYKKNKIVSEFYLTFKTQSFVDFEKFYLIYPLILELY